MIHRDVRLGIIRRAAPQACMSLLGAFMRFRSPASFRIKYEIGRLSI